MASQTSESQKTYIEKEIRFAVWVYSGSLAIFINRVAQELYNMVLDKAFNNLIAGWIAYCHRPVKPNITPGVT